MTGSKTRETIHIDVPENKRLTEAEYRDIRAAVERRVMAHYAVELDKDMPRKIGKHPALAMPYGEKPEPHYERFLCLNGEFEGRGLIVPMPATYAWGYDLVTLTDGTHVAIVKEPMAAPGLTA